MPDVIGALTAGGVPMADETHHHVRSGWVGVDCPGCSPHSQSYRLGFEISTGRCNCWFCGPQNGFGALMRLTGWSKGEVARYWFDDQPILPKSPKKSRATRRKGQRRLKIPAGVDSMGPAHIRYLEDRGFNPEEIERVWEAKGMGPGSKMGWRIWIPIFNKDHHLVSYTSRAITDKGLRYWSCPEGDELEPHKTLLYGEWLVPGDTIIICEGPLDAWAVGPGCVSTCGTGYKPEQMARMAKYRHKYVCFDSSDDAQGRAYDLCKDLEMFPGIVQNIELETGGDPAEIESGELENLRKLLS